MIATIAILAVEMNNCIVRSISTVGMTIDGQWNAVLARTMRSTEVIVFRRNTTAEPMWSIIGVHTASVLRRAAIIGYKQAGTMFWLR